MARDPSTKIFSYATGVPVAQDSILDSSDYNSAIQEISADFNAPLPVEMGGTGASSLETALTGIGAVSSFYLSELFAGFIGHFASPNPPDGWLVADGRAVSRAVYKTLFLRIGTRFGAGDGSTTFDLPDLRGYFIRGADLGRGIDTGRAVASTQSDENKLHGHEGQTGSGPTHTHVTERYGLVTGPSPPISLVVANGTGYTQTIASATTEAAGLHNHAVVVDDTGSEFRPKNIALLPCIKS